MNNISLRLLPQPMRMFLIAFTLVLNIGFFTGLGFIAQTGATNKIGVVNAYNGNENDLQAKELKFKKSAREMLTIVHTHVLSLSFLFFLIGVLTWGTDISVYWKTILTVEPFFSIVLTFGGLYLVWMEYLFFTYVVMVSGIAMTLSFIISSTTVIYTLLRK